MESGFRFAHIGASEQLWLISLGELTFLGCWLPILATFVRVDWNTMRIL